MDAKAGFSEYSVDTKRLADSLLKGESPLSASHEKMISLVNPEARVLEVGCANGFISSRLKEKGCRVTGVEIDPEFAESAKKICDEVICGNIEDETILGKISGEFDHILFGDILEHLKDPMVVVDRLKTFLTSDGTIIASLPNIAIWWMRRDMIRGRFIYTDTGLLDRTHLRFFSYCTAKQFFQDLALTIIDIHTTANDFPFKKRLLKSFPRISERVGVWLAKKRPNLFGFHFVFVLEKNLPA